MENPAIETKAAPVIQEKLLTTEKATELAEAGQKKIDFLNSVEEKVYKGESLNEEEQKQKELFFGDTDIKEVLMYEAESLKYNQYQLATAGINGAEHVQIAFPTGVHHKETEFENWAKENEKPIKELYHYAGTTMDRACESIVAEHNTKTKPEEKLGWSEEDQHAHASRWYAVEFLEDKELKGFKFVFGGTEYRVLKSTDGARWYASLGRSSINLTPEAVDKKLKELDRNIASWIEEKANQTLR